MLPDRPRQGEAGDAHQRRGDRRLDREPGERVEAGHHHHAAPDAEQPGEPAGERAHRAEVEGGALAQLRSLVELLQRLGPRRLRRRVHAVRGEREQRRGEEHQQVTVAGDDLAQQRTGDGRDEADGKRELHRRPVDELLAVVAERTAHR
jgi:hypothetical protein